ncbi:TIGR03618 family F420-dependent PPOX class oxidoreductase [Nocardiopsis sp. CC223A]|uniref:TIGR03618 family F420-dependent PPOX class oxidoreductase n=1 Tax=Nocardiopsis sp. CC223A TaxID=3044051 RepID=UPI0027957527|nr:TIGR03618 family F420-dependent PPOX class oxidoreductase [Nocardiopsis sp. CC223A]
MEELEKRETSRNALWSSAMELARGPNFAVLSTFMPSGRVQSQVMWVDADETALVFNTEVHRKKYRNVSDDPRVTAVVIDHLDPYHYVEVRGRVADVVLGVPAREHIDELSMKYLGDLYPARIISERVILRVVPERIIPGNTE